MWHNYPETKPITYQKGDWDGTRSSLLAVVTKDRNFHVARMYEGILDGSEFQEFVGEDGWDIPNVIMWTELPEPF